LPKLLSLLDRSALYFARADELGDTFVSTTNLVGPVQAFDQGEGAVCSPALRSY
jgi:hypothetical protein